MTPVRFLLCAILSFGVIPPALAEDTEMIVGGKPAPDGKYPWQVRLYQSMSDDKGLCGGSLISDQWVLTAAHCVVQDSSLSENLAAVDRIVVGYGSNDRTATKKLESQKIMVNPGFLAKGLGSGSDVALIKLSDKVPNAMPVTLADPATDERLVRGGTKVTITGWGAIWDPEDEQVMDLLAKLTPREEVTDQINFPLKLHEVEIEVMYPAECRKMYEPLQLTIADSEICAIKPQSVSNSCYGDSGGPLVVYDRTASAYRQVGAVSWGDRCARSGNPNVFARVASFSNWIADTMNADAAATAAAAAEGDAKATIEIETKGTIEVEPKDSTGAETKPGPQPTRPN
jgi:secreted trypsin-like serine protease